MADVIKRREIKLIGVDFWCRAMFVDAKGFYFSAIDKLVDGNWAHEDILENITEEDITYHGENWDDDPMGTRVKPGVLKIVDKFSNEE